MERVSAIAAKGPDNSLAGPWAWFVFLVAGHTGSGVVGWISQRVRPFGVIR